MEELFEIDSSDAAVQEVPGALMVICTKSGGCPSICLIRLQHSDFALCLQQPSLPTPIFMLCQCQRLSALGWNRFSIFQDHQQLNTWSIGPSPHPAPGCIMRFRSSARTPDYRLYPRYPRCPGGDIQHTGIMHLGPGHNIIMIQGYTLWGIGQR